MPSDLAGFLVLSIIVIVTPGPDTALTIRNTTITGNQQTAKWYILDRVKEPEGEILDVPKLNRDVLWFNRTNDVQVKALLQPGTSFGLTDLQFAVIEPPTDTLQLSVDNQGVQSTGRQRRSEGHSANEVRPRAELHRGDCNGAPGLDKLQRRAQGAGLGVALWQVTRARA